MVTRISRLILTRKNSQMNFALTIRNPMIDPQSEEELYLKVSTLSLLSFFTFLRLYVCNLYLLCYIVPGDNYVKHTRMLLDILFWTKNVNINPANLMVISKPFKDSKFDSCLQLLRENGFHVFFAQPDYMFTFGTSLWSAKSLLDSGRSCSCMRPSKSSQPSIMTMYLHREFFKNIL